MARRKAPREAERRPTHTVTAQVDTGTAELSPDPDRPQAWTLALDGTPQSHVDLLEPTWLAFEYVRRLGHLVDVLAPAHAPINVLHLGGGAWTLARYVAATRPGSRQRVVELDGALVEFVRRHLPSVGTGVRVRVGDARDVLGTLAAASVDLIVTDVFSGARIPAHLTSVEFTREVARVVRPDGAYAANIADGAPLAFARAQAATVGAAFRWTCLIGPAQVLRGRRFGNLVLAGAAAELPLAELIRRTASDPFPARVVHGDAYARFAAGARVVTDADATPSPAPPPDVMAVGPAARKRRAPGST